MKQSTALQPCEALMLSLTIAMQKEAEATAAVDQTQIDLNARFEDLRSARDSVSYANEHIREFAAKAQITLVEAVAGRESLGGEARHPGVMPTDEIPAIGTYWAGQGGIYGGIRQYPDGPYHVIFGTKDLGDFAWGERGVETRAFSKTDGRSNTDALVEDLGVYSAAKAASAYSSDGHNDFYLPSIGELNHAWQSIPDAFDKSTWYWSSTQRSANDAFFMTFGDGSQYDYAKGNGLRVRPVRRLPIQ